ncbi:hypothetical protein CC80DRAFT_252176 [Byssothecium circinans]|uniref:DUF7580 domain-containing protein n=1 Tax=Byssothecium circinans TaxID=147558 RepID=A0A6A5TC83_9PLEO|nr:hypothetical protein CC80DRAFT_252176 [Byssothecium circinans]
MSSIKVVGLAIGIVPIVVEILKSYRTTKDRLKSFAHHDLVIDDMHLRYRVAATNFSNNCQLLLKPVVDDPRELSGMVDDVKHEGWKIASLEERFRSFLGRDYELCEEIVVRIRNVLRETQVQLAELDKSDAESSTLNRIHQAFDITLKKNQYHRWLDELDQWNAKLGNLRAQRCELQKRHTYRPKWTVPRRYADIHTASQRLHESLQESWSCTNASHIGHQAKLSLDAQVEDVTAQLDMVIACCRRDSLQSQKGQAEAPIWLHIQSITTNAPTQTPSTKLPALADVPATPSYVEWPLLDTPPFRSVVQVDKKILKRVRFDDLSEQKETSSQPSSKSGGNPKTTSDSAGLSFASQNLKATQSVCCYLSKACLSTNCKNPCLGYLETQEVPKTFKFIFYGAGQNTETQITNKASRKTSNPINGMLQRLTTLHQLTLAHKLAIAVLQYHSTSWLAPDWDLHDVSCFPGANLLSEADITRTLQSLRLSTQFPPATSSTLAKKSQDPNQLKYMYGIRNLTLAKLGVALLEIGFRKDISTLSTEEMPHPVISARKALSEPSSSMAMLGKRYIKMARQCIDCDFSCGEDLNEENLRSAVYTDVVCTLEDMIKDWKRFIGVR